MAEIAYSERALRDLERLTDFLMEQDALLAADTIPLITSAVVVLENHPLIGRPVRGGHRELMISRGSTGYVALYRYLETNDHVFILGIRHQREAGVIDP
ncbi:MAG: type II toxin-antitoxin system RelE/ParE family toxin [Gammaproteobacteria bacterium]